MNWDKYLAPEFTDLFNAQAHTLMYAVGAIEIVAGLVVAVRPRFGGYLVAAWLAGIITNLLLIGDFYDIALRGLRAVARRPDPRPPGHGLPRRLARPPKGVSARVERRVNMQPKRRFPRVVLPIAAGFVAIALLWSAFAVPVLVKYPTDLDVTPRYEGTFTLFVDPTTAAPLATPAGTARDRAAYPLARRGERCVPRRGRGDDHAARRRPRRRDPDERLRDGPSNAAEREQTTAPTRSTRRTWSTAPARIG